MLIKRLSNIFNADGESKYKDSHFKMFSKVNREPADELRIAEVIGWAKQEGYLIRLGITEDSVNDFPEELITNKKVVKELKKVAVDQEGARSPISSDKVKSEYALIEAYEIFQDILYSFNIIFGLVTKPDQFSHLDDSFKSYLDAVIHLPGSIVSDLDPKLAFDKISTQIEQLKAGNRPDSPELLNQTLKTIYSTPGTGDMINVVNALLAPENASLRMVLLIYARLNGINLEQKDIDEVRNTVLNRDNPKLGSLFMYLVKSENVKRLAAI